VVAYIDKILAYSNSMEEHVEHFWKVFQRLREIKLYVKFEKVRIWGDRNEFIWT
jgi:hypothetical protein